MVGQPGAQKQPKPALRLIAFLDPQRDHVDAELTRKARLEAAAPRLLVFLGDGVEHNLRVADGLVHPARIAERRQKADMASAAPCALTRRR